MVIWDIEGFSLNLILLVFYGKKMKIKNVNRKVNCNLLAHYGWTLLYIKIVNKKPKKIEKFIFKCWKKYICNLHFLINFKNWSQINICFYRVASEHRRSVGQNIVHWMACPQIIICMCLFSVRQSSLEENIKSIKDHKNVKTWPRRIYSFWSL